MEVCEWRVLHDAGPRLQPPHTNRCDRHTKRRVLLGTSCSIIEATGPLQLRWREIVISVHSWAVVCRRTWFPFLYLVLLGASTVAHHALARSCLARHELVSWQRRADYARPLSRRPQQETYETCNKDAERTF